MADAPSSPWHPLRHPLYRALWIAHVASSVGTWLQSVGASWLMTTTRPRRIATPRSFLVRSHERVTIADRDIEQRARAFHVGDAPPAVTHLIAEPVLGER